MKKTSLWFGLILLVSSLVPALSLSQQVDLSGTWEGTAEVPDMVELDKITLVLEKSEGSYSGTITDSVGFAQEAELEDVELKENQLTFRFTIFNGEEHVPISATLTVEGNKMTGSWQDNTGESGSIVLEKVS